MARPCWICGGRGCLSCEESIIEATTEAELRFMRFAADDPALLLPTDSSPDEKPEHRITLIKGGKDTVPQKNE